MSCFLLVFRFHVNIDRAEVGVTKYFKNTEFKDLFKEFREQINARPNHLQLDNPIARDQPTLLNSPEIDEYGKMKDEIENEWTMFIRSASEATRERRWELFKRMLTLMYRYIAYSFCIKHNAICFVMQG